MFGKPNGGGDGFGAERVGVAVSRDGPHSGPKTIQHEVAVYVRLSFRRSGSLTPTRQKQCAGWIQGRFAAHRG